MDSEREFLLRAELPGLNPGDIELSISGNSLVLSGEKKAEHEEKQGGFFRSERRYGAFRRVIPLPAGTDPDRISAEYDRGVLVVRVEKSEAAKPRRIEVSAPRKP
jgi:HSP20 family protein